MDVYKFWKGLTIFRQLNINYMRYLCVLLKHSSYDFTILWHKKLLNVAIIYKLVKFLSTLKHIQNWALLVSAVSVELFVKLTQQNQNKPDLPTANIVLYKEREQYFREKIQYNTRYNHLIFKICLRILLQFFKKKLYTVSLFNSVT